MTKNKKWIGTVILLLVLLCGWMAWSKWASTTRIGLVNFQNFQTTSLIKSNEDQFIKYEEVPLEELGRLDRYDFVLGFGMGLRMTAGQREQLQKAADKGTPVYIYAATNPENNICNLDSITKADITSYIGNGNKKNYRNMARYIRRQIDRKLFFVTPADTAVESASDVLFHLDENLSFSTVTDYENYIKGHGFYREGQPKVAIVGGLNDPFSGNRDNIDSLIVSFQRAGLNVYPISSYMKRLAFLKEIQPDAVIHFAHGRMVMGQAAAALSELFVYNIPLRWSISHLYQAILNNEKHVNEIDFLTTLAGYVHWQLTGEKVLGIGDASGMLPIDPATKNYSAEMVAKFDKLVAPKGYSWKLEDILPKVLNAGENAGCLTPEGVKRLDVSGNLKAGIPLCPPEGDAGTGMVATNAVKQRTGNVSAGTSSFSMIVLEKELSKPYEMIDMVTTPDGSLVAMVHCNNCTSDLNAWVNLFKEFQELQGQPVDMDDIYGKLYNHALTGHADCGGLVSYNYFSGEPVTGLAEGRPLFVRSANDKFNLANFMRAHLYASVGVLKIGNDILFNEEKIRVDRITGHGGLFRTKGVGQRVLAAAINSPISVMETAGEGGAWGIALLGSYLVNNEKKQSLADFLDEHVFAGDAGVEVSPTAEDVEGFNKYIENYKAGLPIEEAAVRFKR